MQNRVITGDVSNDAMPVGFFLRDKNAGRGLKPLMEAGGMDVALQVETKGSTAFLKNPPVEMERLRAVIVDLDGQDDPLGLIREVRDRCAGDARIVALGHANDVDFYRKVKAAGADEYFVNPAMADELAQTLRQLLCPEDCRERGAGGGRLIAVHGAQGGCGAGVLSAGLAVYLSQKHGRNTVLVDACLSAPTAGINIGCDQPGNLGLLLEAGDRLDSVLVKQVIQKPLPRLAFLDGYDGVGTPRSFMPETAGLLASLLSREYRYQIWRAGDGAGMLRETALGRADVVVLVMAGTLPSGRSAQNAMRWLAKHNPTARIVTVYNTPSPHPLIPKVAIEEIIGRALSHTIPYQKALARVMLQNTPCNSPAHCLSSHFERISCDIVGAPQSSGGWWKRIAS